MMKMPTIPTLYVVAAGVAAVAVLWVAARGGKDAGQAIGTGTVNLVDGVISGTVIGTTGLVGVPATNLTECERAKLEGRTWDASFACPAKDFISYLWN